MELLLILLLMLTPVTTNNYAPSAAPSANTNPLYQEPVTGGSNPMNL